MLRLDTENLSLAARARLLVKYAMYPGTNWVSREKAHVVRMFLQGTPERPIQTLDCGCGNAFFSRIRPSSGTHVARESRSTSGRSATARRCGPFWGSRPVELEFRATNLATLADDPAERRTIRPGAVP